MRGCVSCIDMSSHLHSRLCLPDAPLWLNSSVDFHLRGWKKKEQASGVRGSSCVHFHTPWSRSCLSYKPHVLHSLSLHPGSISCPTLEQRRLFSFSSQLFNPSHPCTGPISDTVSPSIYSHCTLLVSFLHSSRVEDSKVRLTQHCRARERSLFQVTLTTNAGLTFPCSPNPSSIFSSVAGCILENRVKALCCFSVTKWAALQTHRARVKLWLSRDPTGLWALHAEVWMSPCNGRVF